MEMPFLPKLPPPLSDLVLFGVILIAGLVGGRVVSRGRYLPKITGYTAVGFVLSPTVLSWLNDELIGRMQFFVDISIALVLFQLGRRLDFSWLRHERWLLSSSALECVLSFGLIYFGLVHIGVEPLPAALGAAMGIATSPAVLLLVAGELQAEGQVTNRALSMTAINNSVALVLFAILLSSVHLTFGASLVTIMVHPVYLLTGSLALGYAAFVIMLFLARLVGKQEGSQFILLVGVILAAIGGARTLNLSMALTLLILGITSKNLDKKHDIVEVELGYASQLFYVVLFVALGARISSYDLLSISWAVPVFIIGRAIGKMTGVFAFARASRLSARRALMLSLALLPMAGIALGMTYTVSDMYPYFGAEMADIVTSSIAIFEIIGPIITLAALKWAGEANPDRPN
jgi:NhaP-type Na+/H+ or K+/H+ antiporter